ncbi:MAG: ABC transporter ATP-binding protein [Aeromicrobium sp.]|uniref:ABC transporter ATP-binding protein n=1 Tax=Aeromicrobium sp. TaxID=1871063 RepID=UPI0039E3EB52
MSTELIACGVSSGYGRTTIVRDVDLVLPPGRITSIIGPNGCGKSTLLRTLVRLLPASTGEITLDGRPVTSMRLRELAQSVALLPQNPTAPEGLTVRDLVMRGRQPHQPWYRPWSREDDSIVTEALADTGLSDLAERDLDELSGGQRQRAWIAMALAQRTNLLVLDEPTTHLDLAHAVEVLDLVVDLRRSSGRTVVMVVHDLSLAARYSDHLVVMKRGRVYAEGPPAEVLTSELLDDVFGLNARVFADPEDGHPTVAPVGHA